MKPTEKPIWVRTPRIVQDSWSVEKAINIPSYSILAVHEPDTGVIEYELVESAPSRGVTRIVKSFDLSEVQALYDLLVKKDT